MSIYYELKAGCFLRDGVTTGQVDAIIDELEIPVDDDAEVAYDQKPDGRIEFSYCYHGETSYSLANELDANVVHLLLNVADFSNGRVASLDTSDEEGETNNYIGPRASVALQLLQDKQQADADFTARMQTLLIGAADDMVDGWANSAASLASVDPLTATTEKECDDESAE